MDIRQLREKGLYYTQIGEELGIDPRTAAKYCGDAPPPEGKPIPVSWVRSTAEASA